MKRPKFDQPVDDSFKYDLAYLSRPKRRGLRIVVWLIVLGLVGVGAHYGYRHRRPLLDWFNKAVAKTGHVKVTSIPPGAQVSLDGKRSGATPTQIDKVEPGRRHVLKVTLTDWEPWEKDFVLSNTNRPLTFEVLLRKKEPRLATPTSRPPPRPEAAPRTSRPTPPPKSALPGQAATPARERPFALPVVLVDAKGEGTASLLVTSQPAGAEIYLDGLPTKKHTPATFRKVPAGVLHAVQVSLTGYPTAQQTVTPARNSLTKLKLVLPAGFKPGPVRIESVPSSAVVLVDGKRVKQLTPVTLRLPGKPSQVEVTHRGYGRWTRVVSPVPGVKLQLTAYLQRR